MRRGNAAVKAAVIGERELLFPLSPAGRVRTVELIFPLST
jgi:hypothetical protein